MGGVGGGRRREEEEEGGDEEMEEGLHLQAGVDHADPGELAAGLGEDHLAVHRVQGGGGGDLGKRRGGGEEEERRQGGVEGRRSLPLYRWGRWARRPCTSRP